MSDYEYGKLHVDQAYNFDGFLVGRLVFDIAAVVSDDRSRLTCTVTGNNTTYGAGGSKGWGFINFVGLMWGNPQFKVDNLPFCPAINQLENLDQVMSQMRSASGNNIPNNVMWGVAKSDDAAQRITHVVTNYTHVFPLTAANFDADGNLKDMQIIGYGSRWYSGGQQGTVRDRAVVSSGNAYALNLKQLQVSYYPWSVRINDKWMSCNRKGGSFKVRRSDAWGDAKNTTGSTSTNQLLTPMPIQQSMDVEDSVAQPLSSDDKTYDLWFGDSQMYGYGIKDNTTRATKRFSYLVSEADNATDVNVSVSGTNWTGNTSNKFGNQIDRLIENYSGKNVRRVIGQGVHNDAKESPAISASSTDTELKAKAKLMADTAKPYYTKLRNAFPNAQLAYIPQVTVWGTAQKSNTFFAAVLKTGAYLVDYLKQQGWTVMNMDTDLSLIGDHQDYLADSIHVNEKGHAAAAQGIVKWLNTTDVPIDSDKPSVTFTVTFNTNGGSAVQSQTVEQGKTATKPSDPTRSGYTFAGWTLNGQTYDFSTPVTANITLTATWTQIKPKTFTVTFNTNGGSAVQSQTVNDGSKATRPTDPKRDGYIFAGWTLNGQSYDWNTSVTDNITLVAQWTKAQQGSGKQHGFYRDGDKWKQLPKFGGE